MKIPFQFVAAGQTFPAGEYKISRLSDSQSRILLLSNRENRAAVVMFPTETQDISHDKAKLAFATVGDQHFLSRIENRKIRLHSFGAQNRGSSGRNSPAGLRLFLFRKQLTRYESALAGWRSGNSGPRCHNLDASSCVPSKIFCCFLEQAGTAQ